MIYAVDTFYHSDKAKTVGIGFDRWDADVCTGIWEDWRAVPDEYVSGEFYKREVLRGGSARPLYITAIGIDLDLAADHIRQMKGAYRIPDLLKKLDQLTRTNG